MRILLDKKIVEEIETKCRAKSSVNEMGGLLLGYRKAGAVQLVDATWPNIWDHATPTLFRRSSKGHRMQAIRRWKKSGQTCDWLGEWHTHPGGPTIPSGIDRDNWKRISGHTHAPMVFLIFNDTDFGVYLQRSRWTAVQRLQRREENRSYCLFA